MKNAYESENIIANLAWRNDEDCTDYQMDIQITGETFKRIVKLAGEGLYDDGEYEENEALLNQLYEIRDTF